MNNHLIPSAAATTVGASLLAVTLTGASATAARTQPAVDSQVFEHHCFAVRHSWNESLEGPQPLCRSLVARVARAVDLAGPGRSYSEAVSRRVLGE